LTIHEAVTVSGSGFKPGEGVVLTLEIDKLNRRVIGGGVGSQISANNGGAFAAEFDHGIGGRPTSSGVRTLLATGSDGSLASIPVTILDAAVMEASPSTSLIVGSVVTGGNATIWGAGFMGGETISISAGGSVLAGGSANSSGAFEMEMAVDLEPGIYTAKAVGDMGSVATAPLAVVASK